MRTSQNMNTTPNEKKKTSPKMKTSQNKCYLKNEDDAKMKSTPEIKMTTIMK